MVRSATQFPMVLPWFNHDFFFFFFFFLQVRFLTQGPRYSIRKMCNTFSVKSGVFFFWGGISFFFGGPPKNNPRNRGPSYTYSQQNFLLPKKISISHTKMLAFRRKRKHASWRKKKK